MKNQEKKDFLSGMVEFGKAYTEGLDKVNAALVTVVAKEYLGIDLKGKVPSLLSTLFDVGTKLTGTEAKAPPACGGGASLACGAATATVEHEVKASSDPNGKNPMQETDPESRKATSQILEQCGEIAKGVEKKGLKQKSMKIENKADGSTIISQLFEYAPQDLKNGAKELGIDVTNPDDIEGLIEGAKEVGQFFGLWE